MDPYERIHLADGIKDAKYKEGEYIIKEVKILKNCSFSIHIYKKGEEGKYFYMIEEGHLKATKISNDSTSYFIKIKYFIKLVNGEEQVVYEYKEGDYFGELALVKNIPR